MQGKHNHSYLVFFTSLSILLLSSFVEGHAGAEHALDTINGKIKNNPYKASFIEQRARTHIRLGNLQAALDDFKHLKKLGEVDRALLGESDIQRLRDDCKNAIKNYSKLIEKKSLRKNALVGRADCYQSLGDIDKQVLDMETIIEEFSDYELEYHYKLAQILSSSEKHGPQEALKRINQVIKRHGPLVHFQELAIKQNLELQQYEEAKERLMSIEQWMGKTDKWKNQLAEIDTLINNKKGDRYEKVRNN